MVRDGDPSGQSSVVLPLAREGVGPALLDLHGGLSDKSGSKRGKGATCDRWPKALRLVSSAGHFVAGRCRATNLCAYCATLSAVEYAEMFSLDAMIGRAPTLWLCLTTPTATLDTASFYRARENVIVALRRRFGRHVEYAALVEFTTGYAANDGARRPHWNMFVKGVEGHEVEAGEVAIRAWLASMPSSKRVGQHAGHVTEFGGLMRYVTLHFLKESQRPPDGWKGQRVMFSTGRNGVGGYFNVPVWKVREQAKRSLRMKRELWRAESKGLAPDAAQLEAEYQVLVAEGVRWECVVLDVDGETGVVRGARGLDGREPKVMRVDKTRNLAARMLRASTEGELHRGEYT